MHSMDGCMDGLMGPSCMSSQEVGSVGGCGVMGMHVDVGMWNLGLKSFQGILQLRKRKRVATCREAANFALSWRSW